MSAGLIRLQLVPYRLLSKSAGAHYCHRSPKTFQAQCPVSPIKMPNGDELYDVRDLDAWIDSLKAGTSETNEDILARLG